MHRFHGIERDRKITRVLDVDHKPRAAVGRNRADRAKLFAAIRYKGLESDFDVLLHGSLLAVITTRLYRAVRTRAKDHPAAWLVAHHPRISLGPLLEPKLFDAGEPVRRPSKANVSFYVD